MRTDVVCDLLHLFLLAEVNELVGQVDQLAEQRTHRGIDRTLVQIHHIVIHVHLVLARLLLGQLHVIPVVGMREVALLAHVGQQPAMRSWRQRNHRRNQLVVGLIVCVVERLAVGILLLLPVNAGIIQVDALPVMTRLRLETLCLIIASLQDLFYSLAFITPTRAARLIRTVHIGELLLALVWNHRTKQEMASCTRPRLVLVCRPRRQEAQALHDFCPDPIG